MNAVDRTPEALGALLENAVAAAQSGRFDDALRALVDHDAAVRDAFAGAPVAERSHWRVLLDLQQRTVERLVALRDAAGAEFASVAAARRSAVAYDAGP